MSTAVSTGPYAAEVPRDDRPPAGYQTAADHLADALQHTAPALSKRVEYKLGKQATLELATAVRRAVALAVRHKAEDIAAALLADAADLYRQWLAEQAPTEPAYVCREPGCEWTSGDLDPIEAQYAHVDHQDEHEPADDEDDGVLPSWYIAGDPNA